MREYLSALEDTVGGQCVFWGHTTEACRGIYDMIDIVESYRPGLHKAVTEYIEQRL